MFNVTAEYCMDYLYCLLLQFHLLALSVRSSGYSKTRWPARSPSRRLQTIPVLRTTAEFPWFAYQVGLGPAGPCATISRWLLTGVKDPGTQLKGDLPVGLPVSPGEVMASFVSQTDISSPFHQVKVCCCAMQQHVADELGIQMSFSGAFFTGGRRCLMFS
jgi:hypothetical protein